MERITKLSKSEMHTQYIYCTKMPVLLRCVSLTETSASYGWSHVKRSDARKPGNRSPNSQCWSCASLNSYWQEVIRESTESQASDGRCYDTIIRYYACMALWPISLTTSTWNRHRSSIMYFTKAGEGKRASDEISPHNEMSNLKTFFVYDVLMKKLRLQA